MLTKEQAIKVLIEERQPHYYAKCKYGGIIGDAYNMAIAALNSTPSEHQTLKMPDLEGDSVGDNGELLYDIWICPCCGIRRDFETENNKQKYCSECGQAIDWSNIKI